MRTTVVVIMHAGAHGGEVLVAELPDEVERPQD